MQVRGPVRRAVLGTAGVCALLVPASCTSSPQPRAAPTGAPPVVSTAPAPGTSSGSGVPGTDRAPAHVVIVVFENKSDRQLADPATAPWLHEVMAAGAVFTNSRAVSHPSQPNYIALFSGSTQGVTSDHCPERFGNTPNLAQQLIASGRSFAGYSEDLPRTGFTGCSSGLYAAKHNPWVDFSNVPDAANRPFTAFPTDYSTLPTLSFVIPNLCDDMHNCPVATGDAWGRAHLDGYLQWARQHDSLLVVTFDEDDNHADNRILTLFAGAGIRTGTYPQAITHYTVLRTLESWYGLAALQRAADATPITGIWGGPS